MIKKYLLVFTGVLGGMWGIHVGAATASDLPPVTIGSGIWLERGRATADHSLRAEVERLEGELRKTRAAQTGLISELERTQSRLLKTRESEEEQRKLQQNLELTRKQLSALSAELEDMELTSINKERTLLRQVDLANQARVEALADLKKQGANQMSAKEMNRLKIQIDQLKRIREAQEKEKITLLTEMEEEKAALLAEMERLKQPDSKQNEVIKQLENKIASIEKAREINNRVLADTQKKLNEEKQLRTTLEKKMTAVPADARVKQEALIKKQQAELAKEKANAASIRTLKSKVDQELANLQKELQTEKARVAELEKLSNKHNSLKKEISELNSFITSSQDTQRTQLEDVTALSAERESLKQLVEEFEGKINAQKGELEKQHKLVENLKPTSQPKGTGITPVPNPDQAHRIAALNEQLFRHKSLLDKARGEQKAIEDRLLETEGELARSKNSMKAMESRLLEVSKGKSPADARTTQLNAVMKQLEAREAELAKLSAKEQALNTKQPNTRLLESKINALTRERSQLKARMEQQARELEDLRKAAKTAAVVKPSVAKPVAAKPAVVVKPAGPVKPAVVKPAVVVKPAGPVKPADLKTPVTSPPATSTTDTAQVPSAIIQSAPAVPPTPVPAKAITTTLQPAGPIKPIGPPTLNRQPSPQVQQVIDRMLASANRKFKAGKTDDALREYNAALKIIPGHTRASLGLATAYYTLGRMDDATRIVHATLARDAKNPQAIGLESIINWREGDYEVARKRIDEAIKIDPKDAMLHNYLGIIAHSMGDTTHAMTALNQAVALDPFNAEVRFNLAVLSVKENKLDQAKKHYEAAIQMGSRPDKRLEDKIYK